MADTLTDATLANAAGDLAEERSWSNETMASVFLGEVATHSFLQNVVTSALVFGVMQQAVLAALPWFVPEQRWKPLSTAVRSQIAGWVVSFIHAVVACVWLAYVFFVAPGDIWEDRIYGVSPAASGLCALTIGYFIFDTSNCFRAANGLDPAFLAHHVAGIVTLAVVSHPFVHFYGTGLVIFELSTPFLSVRKVLLALGYKGSRAVTIAEQLFGVSFMLCRIAFGIPFSMMGIYEATVMLMDGKIKCLHHYPFLLVTNSGLNILNIVWARKLVRMAARNSTKAKAL